MSDQVVPNLPMGSGQTGTQADRTRIDSLPFPQGREDRLGDPEFRGWSIVLGTWIALGTGIYSVRQGWGLVDSRSLPVMTINTIGYGDFAPSTSGMRLSTIVFSVMGIGLFVACNARLAQFAFEGRRRDDSGGSEDETAPC